MVLTRVPVCRHLERAERVLPQSLKTLARLVRTKRGGRLFNSLWFEIPTDKALPGDLAYP